MCMTAPQLNDEDATNDGGDDINKPLSTTPRRPPISFGQAARFLLFAKRWQHRRTVLSGKRVVIFADPGPDPDDTKVIMTAAMMHMRKELHVEALICNGGGQAAERTALAKTVLGHICGGAKAADRQSAYASDAIPMYVCAGHEEANAYTPKPHEYQIEGFDHALAEVVSDPSGHDGAAAFAHILHAAPDQSLVLQVQSGMADVARAIRRFPELFKRKVCLCSIMGGLRNIGSQAGDGSDGSDGSSGSDGSDGGDGSDGSCGGWVADTAANNMFDLDAAQAVYRFCLKEGVRMHVVARDAVPHLPMALAKEFADRPAAGKGKRQARDTTAANPNPNPVMAYLYDAQKLGLVGLWANVCAAEDYWAAAAKKNNNDANGDPAAPKLPRRCNRRWFFTTFCGVSGDEFDAKGLATMGADEDIEPWLRGTIKPYDVVAFMTLLPDAHAVFDFGKAEVRVNGQKHYFFLDKANAPPQAAVYNLLRGVFDTYTA